MKSSRFLLRVLVSLLFGGVAFVVGLCLPLFLYEIVHGDPGMPGGASLAFLGFPMARQ
jgi:hypothetical protein